MLHMSTLLILASEHAGQGFWQDYLGLLSNPAHFLFEWTNEIVTGIVLIPLWRRAKQRAIREHDARFHPAEHVDHDSCMVD